MSEPLLRIMGRLIDAGGNLLPNHSFKVRKVLQTGTILRDTTMTFSTDEIAAIDFQVASGKYEVIFGRDVVRIVVPPRSTLSSNELLISSIVEQTTI